jgi:hypothetical protein
MKSAVRHLKNRSYDQHSLFGFAQGPEIKLAPPRKNHRRAVMLVDQVIFGAVNLADDFLAATRVHRQGTIALPMTLSEQVIAHFEELRMPVFRFLVRRTRDTARAEELTQETFLRLCRHLQEGRALDNPKAWLFTVANNLAVDTEGTKAT